MLLRVVPVAVGVLLACGSSNKGGGGSGATPSLPVGTVLGVSFNAQDGAAVIPAAVVCQETSGPVNASLLLVGFGDFPGLCGRAMNQQCALKPSATIVSVLVLRAGPSPQPAIAAGTYPLTTGTPTPDAAGNVLLGEAFITRTDAACHEPETLPTASGSITLSAVGSGRVGGRVDVAFSDGGRLTGPFDVAICPAAIDVCGGGPSCPGGIACQP